MALCVDRPGCSGKVAVAPLSPAAVILSSDSRFSRVRRPLLRLLGGISSLAILLASPSAYATTTSWVTPTPAVGSAIAGKGDGDGFETDGGVGTRDLSTVNTSYISDNNSGTVANLNCFTADHDWHKVEGFGTSLVPRGATINGIELDTRSKWDSINGTPGLCFRLCWGATANDATCTAGSGTGVKTVTGTTAWQQVTVPASGGSTDTWNHAWTTDEINSANFHVEISTISDNILRDVDLDYLALRAYYTIRTWVGDGTTLQCGAGNEANVSCRFNWDGDVALASGAAVTFPAGTGSAVWDAGAPASVSGVALQSGYANSVTLAQSLTVTNNLSITAGTLAMGTLNLSVNGNTVIDGSTAKLQTGTGIMTFGDAAGDSVTISAGTLEIQSDNTTTDIVKNASTWTHSGGTVSYVAATAVSTSLLSSLSPYANLTVNSSGSTYTADGDIWVMSITPSVLTVSAGTLQMGAHNLTVGLLFSTTTGGSIVGAGTINQTGGYVSISGYGYLGGTSSSSCSGVNGPYTFNGLVIQAVANLAGPQDSGVSLCGNVTVTAFSIGETGDGQHTTSFGGGSATLTLTDSGSPFSTTSSTKIFSPGTGKVVYTGSSSTNIGTGPYYNLDIGGSATTATYTAAGNLTVGHVLTIAGSSGTNTFDPSTRTITLTGAGTPFVITGNEVFKPTLTPSTSTVLYTGGSTTDVAATTYDNLQVNGTGPYNAAGAIVANGDVTVTAGTLAMGTNALTVGTGASTGSITGAGAITSAASSLTTLKGTGDLGGGTYAFYNLTLGDGSNTKATTLAGSAVSVSNALVVNTSHTLSLSTNSLTVGTGAATGSITGAGAITSAASSLTTLKGTGTLGGGAYAFYNLTLGDGSNTKATTLTGSAVSVANALTVSASHTLGLSTFDLTVGTGANYGVITGAGAIAQTSGTMRLYGDSVLGGAASTTNPSTCLNANGSYQFYNLTVGNVTNTKATTACGNFTVSNLFTIATNQTFNAGSYTVTLTLTGTPFVVNGLFNEDTGSITYQPSTAAGNTTITSETYYNLTIVCSDTSANHTALLAGPVTATSTGYALVVKGFFPRTTTLDTAGYTVSVPNGTLLIGVSGFASVGAVKANGSTIAIHENLEVSLGTFTQDSSTTTIDGSLNIVTAASSIFTKGSGTLTFNGTGATKLLSDASTTKQDLGTVTINGAYSTPYSIKATSLTINNTKSLDISGDTLTLTGTGTPLTLTGTGTLTENTSSTVEFAATSSTTTVNARTYGGNLKINGSGGAFTAGGTITVTVDLNVAAGSFSLNGQNVAVNGGDFYGAGTVYCGNGNNTCAAGTTTVSGASEGGKGLGDNGSTYTFYSLMLKGNGQTTTFAGNIETKAGFYCGEGTSHTCTTAGKGLTVNNNLFIYGVTAGAGNAVFQAEGSTVTVVTGNVYLFHVLVDNTKLGTYTAGTSTLILKGDAPFVGQCFAPGSGTMSFTTATLKIQNTVTCSVPPVGTLANLEVGTDVNTTAAVSYALEANTTVSGTVTVGNASSSFTDTIAPSSFTLTLSGTGTPLSLTSKGLLDATAGTVAYTNGTSANVTATTYNNLTLNGTGTFTPAGNIAVNGALIVQDGTLPVGGADFIVSGTTTISAAVSNSLEFSSAAGTKTFTGLVTINLGGNWDNYGNAPVTFGGGITNNGDSESSFSSGAGIQTFNASQALGGSQALYFNGTMSISGAVTITNNTTVTSAGAGGITGTVAGSTWVNAANATLNVTGPLLTTGTLTATANPNTVAYKGANQTVKATTYHHLTCNGAGPFTAGGAIIANGDLTVTAGTLAMGANDLTVGTGAGNGVITGAGAITQSTPGITTLKGDSVLGGAASTTNPSTCSVGANGSFQFFDLIAGDNANAKTTTLCGDVNVSNRFTIAGGTATQIFDGGTAKTVTLSGTGVNAFVISGTFTPNTGKIKYTGGAATNVKNTTYYDLETSGTGPFNAAGNLIATNTVAVTAGTLAMGTNSLTVGTGTTNGAITGAGVITQAASGTTTLKGASVLGGATSTANPLACNGANGSFTFYNLTVGDGTNAKTTTACGNFTVSNQFTIRGTAGGDAANHIFDGTSGSSRIITLTGSGSGASKPFIVNGTFTYGTSSIRYRGTSATDLTALSGTGGTNGYAYLDIVSDATFSLSGNIAVNASLNCYGATAPNNCTLTTTGNNYSITVTWDMYVGDALSSGARGILTVNAGTVVIGGDLNLDGATINEGTGQITAGSLYIYSATTWNNGTTHTLKLNQGAGHWSDAVGVDVGEVEIDNSITANSDVKAKSVTINAAKSLSISGNTLTLTGSGTPLVNNAVVGNFNTAGSTVAYTSATGATIGTTNIIYNHLTFNGTGPYTAAGDITANGTITAQAGTFAVEGNTVTAGTATINGGTLSMIVSGGKLRLSGGGTLSMSSGGITIADVATPVELTTSDTGTPTYVGVSLTGGTLNVAELDVDYLKSTGFVIGSGVTLTAFDQVRWGGSGANWHGQAAVGEVMLDITSQTKNLLNHVFPTTWANQGATDCNVRSNTSLVVTMWDWSGAYGGEDYDCDATGGEVVWQGGPGGAHPNSGTHQYPAIY
jgi:hypothetical protein